MSRPIWCDIPNYVTDNANEIAISPWHRWVPACDSWGSELALCRLELALDWAWLEKAYAEGWRISDAESDHDNEAAGESTK